MKNSLTKRQVEILNLIFKFRFVSILQIQRLFSHKYSSRINKWILSMMQEGYIGRVYDRYVMKGRLSSILYLDKRGIVYIKNEYMLKGSGYFKKLSREEKVSFVTKDHSLKTLDIYILLLEYANEHGHILKYFSKAELSQMSLYRDIKADGYFIYETHIGKRGVFLEIDLESESSKTFLKKIRKYIDFYFTFKWSVSAEDIFPIVCIICVTHARKVFLLNEIEKIMRLYVDLLIIFKIVTFKDIQEKGFMSEIWLEPFMSNSKVFPV